MRYIVNVQLSVEATSYAQAAEFARERLTVGEVESLPLYVIADSLGVQKVFDMQDDELREVPAK